MPAKIAGVFHIRRLRFSTIKAFDDPEADLRNLNTMGTVRVVQACIWPPRRPRLLYASSMTAYGNPSKLPVVSVRTRKSLPPDLLLRHLQVRG